MRFPVLKDVSISLLETYVKQVFLMPLTTWTPEVIQQEDGSESFELFTSYSIEYGLLELFDNNSYKYYGPMHMSEETVAAATEADIIRYRRFIVPDWALPNDQPWVYKNRNLWVSPLHFHHWALSSYSRTHDSPIHYNFVPENDPVRMDAGDLYPKHGVWFYLINFPSTFPLVIPMSSADLPVDFSLMDFDSEENTIVSYCIFPNLIHHLASFMRRDPFRDISPFFDYYAVMQPAYVAPAGSDFTLTYLECGEYSCVADGFGTQICRNGLAPTASDPRIPVKYMAPDMIRLPGIEWAIRSIFKQAVAKRFLCQCCGHSSV